MKRFILFLFVLSCLYVNAQTRSKSFTFNVSSASWLNQYGITTESDIGSSTVITSKVFKSSDNSVSVSFDRGTGLDIRVIRESTSGSHYLTIPRLASMIVTGNGVNITGFHIPGTDGQIAGLKLIDTGTDPMVGTFTLNSAQTWYEWASGVNDITSLKFQYQSATVCSIHQIVVDYEAPRDVLSPTSTSIPNNTTITSFSSIALTFANNMSVTSDVSMTLKDANDVSTPVTATANGKVITISTSNPITTEGTYTLTVNAGSFADADDYRNEKLVYTFKILKNFEIQSISPAAGVVTSIPDGIILTFEGAVGTVDGTKIVQITDGNNSVIRSATAAATGTNTVTLTFSNPSSITENGIFTLSIPEKLVYDATGTHYNAETTFTYNIGDLASDELKAKAASLLAKSGVGYPTTDNAARTALAGMSATASTSDYNTAITDYLQTTGIEMPVSGNYYYLKAVAKGGAQEYVKYLGGAVSLTSSSTDATAFKLEGSAGTYNFITPDNKYLNQLGSTIPVSTTATSLTIGKLQIAAAGITDEDVFGLFSLYGDFEGSNAYALVNMNGSFATNPGLGLVNFTTTLTNGFALEVVPDANIPVADAVFALTPSSGSSVSQLSAVTITFPGIPAVTLANQSLIKLIKSDNSSINPASVSLATGKTNEYVITFTDVKSGSYTLTIGKGAFTYNYTLPNTNVISAAVQAIAATYTVTQGDDFVYDFLNKNVIYYRENTGADEPIKDSSLNDMTFYSEDQAIGISNQVVNIVNYNTSEVIATGKFVVVASDETLPNAKGIIKLQLDQPIAEGSLPAAMYSYVIQEGTFGDANFGAYQANPAAFLATGKTKADCHANSYLYYIKTVDNSKASDNTGGGGNTPVTPEAPSAEMLAKVKTFLDMSGVGYPTATASARITLQGAWASKSVSDDVMQNMLVSYLSTSDIVRPTTGKYYTIAAQSLNGTKAYLKYENGDVTTTSDASQASLFKATTTGSKTAFSTSDGNFLTVLTASGNILSAYNATVNDLSLNILPVSNDQLEKSFGLVTLEGIKGDVSLMSKVNVNTPAIISTDHTFAFTNDETTGFKLTETDPSVVPAPTPILLMNPESGSSLTSLQNLELTISGVTDVKLADKSKITITDSKQNITTVSSVTSLGNGKFRLSFPEVEGSDYTMSVAEGAFTFQFMDRTVNVPALTAYYSVKQYVTESVMTLAKQLLGKTGVGYPSSGSQSRLALKNLVDAAGDTNLGSDKAFWAAINAFRAETDIEKPISEKFYRIASVTSTGYAYYLKNSNGKLSLTANDADGIVFKATANANGTTVFVTIADNAKYLNLPTDGAAFSDVYTAAQNNLTLARLQIEGVEDAQTFGRLSISNGGKFAIADASALAVLSPRNTISFGSSETSGFIIEEVDKNDIQMPDASYTLTPENKSTVKTLDKVTISFSTENKVTLADASLIKLTDLRLTEIKAKEVKAVEGKENTFDIVFVNLQASEYRLTIAKGAFVLNFLGNEAPVQEIVADFIVENSAEFIVDYDQANDVEWGNQISTENYVTDTSLNSLSLVSESPVVVDIKKTVVIQNYWSYAQVASGHLELVETNAARGAGSQNASAYTMMLVLDNEINEGDIKAGKYQVIIPEATFGDENFGKYLLDPTSVSMSECHVNKKMTLTIQVDNDKATGIFDITIDGVDGVIYDLQGRAIENRPVRGQVYIKNGKKFVIK